MKICLITFLLLIISQLLVAQTSFFKTYRRPSHERAFSSVQTDDGSFIIAGEISESGYYGIKEGYLAIISGTGDLVNESLINPNDNSRFCIILPYHYGNAEYICIGSTDSISDTVTYSRIVFYGIDTEMSIAWQKLFSFQMNYTIVPWQQYISHDSVLYLMNTNINTNANPSSIDYVSVIKYSLPFDSLCNYKVDFSSHTQDAIFKEVKEELDIYLFPPTIVKLDKDLNYISTTDYNNRFLSTIDLTSINDTNFLFTGSAQNSNHTNALIGCIHYNDDDVAIDSLYYTPNNDTNFYAGGRQNTAINGNNIFITGFYNVYAMPFPYNANPSWVSVTKADMALNVISNHFYGGDAQYCPYSIIPTIDGGCFVTGYSYDYINNLAVGNYELDIFALKVDSLGLITQLPDQPKNKAHDAIVFPSQGRDYLTIQSGPQISGAQFTLYNIQGNVEREEKIDNKQMRTNTVNLVPGVYPWKIVFNNKVIESGKWVKE
ncbi:MAG: T9SS type A sorting domain-containing protein [Bacteroidota bacterium]